MSSSNPPHAPVFESRFTAMPRWAARLILAMVAALMLYGAIASQRPHQPDPPMPPVYRYDIVLYKAVAARVGKGENYYNVVVAEQRWRGIPLRPFVTVRPPLLAVITGYIGVPMAGWLLRALALVTLIALVVRFETTLPQRASRYAALALGTAAIMMFMSDDMAMLHDVWASLWVTLSLALYRPQCWGSSLILGLIAVFTRELTLPYLVVMATAALIDGQRGQACAWGGAIAVALAGLAIHAHMLAPLVTAHDMPSPGWVSAGGWPFILTMVELGTVFRWLPDIATALLVPLALLGWAGWRHCFALRTSFWLLGMLTAFMLVGRADNFYWVLHLSFMLPMGLAFAPMSAISMARAAR